MRDMTRYTKLVPQVKREQKDFAAQTPASPSFHTVPMINAEKVEELKTSYHNSVFTTKLVGLLTADISRLLPELKKSVQTQEMFRIRFYLKRLKSTISNVGAARAVQLIEDLENEISGREIDWPTVRALVAVLEPECQMMCEEVKRAVAG